MRSSLESNHGKERAEFRESIPTIRLEFFRHDKKSGSKTESGEIVLDEKIRLSEAGRKHAQESGHLKNPDPNVALVYGSPRDRTIETAYRQMLANQPEVTAETTFEDIEELVRQNLPMHASKEIQTEKLNFHPSASAKFQKAADDSYERTFDYLVFLHSESDKLAEKVGDKQADTYSRFAASIAEIIAKYVNIYGAWKRITEKDEDKYKKSNFEIQRFVGTHQAIGESFLMKAIEKTEGEEGVNLFLEMLPDKNGFGVGDGFSAEITEDKGEKAVVLKYRDKTWKVNPEIIDQIVSEGK